MDRRYWDSDCFLGWFEGESDKEPLCRAVLEAAEAGTVLIVASALTITEVLHLKGAKPIPRERRERVEKFFRNEYITVRNITRRVAEEARELVWDHGIDPKDALHVATALDAGLHLFNTFDEPLIRKWKLVNNSSLIIERPQLTEPPLPFGDGKK